MMQLLITNDQKKIEADVPDEVLMALSSLKLDDGSPGFSDEDNVVRGDAQWLAEEFARIAKVVKEESAEHYQFIARCRIEGDPTYETEGSGGVQGFSIEGLIGRLVHDINVINLELRRREDDGSATLVETRDIRHLKQLDTDDWGRIYIKKRKVAGTAEKWLKAMAKTIGKMNGVVVMEIS